MNGKRKPSPDFSFSSSSSSSPTLLSLTPLDVERAAGPVRRPSVVTGLKQKQLSRQGSPPVDPLTLTEYEPAYSPDGSSNASSEGPVYVRKPGFEHHAQEFERRPHGDHGGHRSKSAARTKKKRGVVCGPAEGRTNAGDGKTTGGEVPGSSKNKNKNKKDPLPMRLRALPQSFWQQPNKPTSLSPGAIFPVLPPLKEDNVSADDGAPKKPWGYCIRNVVIGGGGGCIQTLAGSTHGEAQRSRRQVISVANTDLLFSLFREVEEEERTRQGEMWPTLVRRGRIYSRRGAALPSASNQCRQHRPAVQSVQRSRGRRENKTGGDVANARQEGEVRIKLNFDLQLLPALNEWKEGPKKPPSTIVTRMLRDEDPCLVSTMTESILPLIPDRGGSGLTAGTSRLAQGQQVLAMVALKDGDRSVFFPSLSVEHNYPQILSEIVIKL
uniref:Uncharacterized protein n=1 Tax=Timema monikensis TaxID=170555 RepID=A0A7R9E8X6_9NEOP|nr:unnamed protein product [Timema monikensis]